MTGVLRSTINELQSLRLSGARSVDMPPAHQPHSRRQVRHALCLYPSAGREPGRPKALSLCGLWRHRQTAFSRTLPLVSPVTTEEELRVHIPNRQILQAPIVSLRGNCQHPPRPRLWAGGQGPEAGQEAESAGPKPPGSTDPRACGSAETCQQSPSPVPVALGVSCCFDLLHLQESLQCSTSTSEDAEALQVSKKQKAIQNRSQENRPPPQAWAELPSPCGRHDSRVALRRRRGVGV